MSEIVPAMMLKKQFKVPSPPFDMVCNWASLWERCQAEQAISTSIWSGNLPAWSGAQPVSSEILRVMVQSAVSDGSARAARLNRKVWSGTAPVWNTAIVVQKIYFIIK